MGFNKPVRIIIYKKIKNITRAHNIIRMTCKISAEDELNTVRLKTASRCYASCLVVINLQLNEKHNIHRIYTSCFNVFTRTIIW